MFAGKELFVGRKEELARGARASARAFAGDGSVLLFFGEAGLGKTRVAQAIARGAASQGARVVWGRAWEAGGAPSYWPWIQIFRALGANEDPFAAAAAGNLELPQARFTTFDRAARWLKEEAAETPLVIVLDDLHAADVPSLLFLQFVARDLAGTRLLIVGTYRDVEARLGAEVGALLSKIAREGEAVGLDRLSKADVLEWICTESGESADAAMDDAERVYSTTEGNALFVHELLRVRGRTSLVEATKTAGLRAILDEHLARLTPATRALLEVGSVLGRDLDVGLVAGLSGSSHDAVDGAFREAREVGLLASLAGGERLSFAHILLRERFYSELVPSRRAALHAATAELLIGAGGDLATATHHLFESSSAPSRIADVARDAAKSALARLAFEDAALLCARALARYDADDERTLHLELVLGEALMRAGKIADGREVCVRAAARAKRLDCPARQAEAALAYATEFATGSVDPAMVAILGDALEALPKEDSPVRARVLARFAASLVPPNNHGEVDEILAKGAAAIEMARRSGDTDTLLFALHYGGSASGYLVSAQRRHGLLGELYDLASSHDRALVMLNVGGWWAVALREQGRPAEAEAVFANYERLLKDFPQPYYRWRVPMLRATFASLDGDSDAAQRLGDEALEIAVDGEIGTGRVAWALNRMSIAHIRGEPASVAPDAARIEAVLGRMAGAKGFLAWLHAASGDHERARPMLETFLAEGYHYPWCLLCSEGVCLLGDVPLAERYYPFMAEHAKRNSLFWGPFGTVVFGPSQRIAGDLAALLGRHDEARRWYGDAIALGERMKAPAIVRLAQRGLAALVSASAAPVSPPSVRTKVEIAIVIIREGEMWSVSSSSGDAMHLKDSKGLLYLSHLISRPGQELHVTQLAELSDVSGDAAVVLDARAKAAYKDRLEALREQLAEASRFGDARRAASVQEEIDTIADQLAAAVGLGGRDRKIGSHVERVRINVQRRIRDAIQRIAQHDAALGRTLEATIKTGVFCIFSPL